MDPLSQIPDAPRHSAGPRKHKSEATLVLRGRQADALRDKALAEHSRGERLKKAKLAGFVLAAVVALGGGAYLARVSSAPPTESAEGADQAEVGSASSVVAARPAAVPDSAAPAASDVAAPAGAAPDPHQLDQGSAKPSNPAPAEATSERAASSEPQAAAPARERSNDEEPAEQQAESGVLTLDQLPTAD